MTAHRHECSGPAGWDGLPPASNLTAGKRDHRDRNSQLRPAFAPGPKPMYRGGRRAGPAEDVFTERELPTATASTSREGINHAEATLLITFRSANHRPIRILRQSIVQVSVPKGTTSHIDVNRHFKDPSHRRVEAGLKVVATWITVNLV